MSTWIRYLQDDDTSGLSRAHARHEIFIFWYVLGLWAWSDPSKATYRERTVSLIRPVPPFVGRESIRLHGTPASDHFMADIAEVIASRAIWCSLFARDANDRDESWVSDPLASRSSSYNGARHEGLDDEFDHRSPVHVVPHSTDLQAGQSEAQNDESKLLRARFLHPSKGYI